MHQQVLAYFGLDPVAINTLILQLMGALYFSFAMISWTAKANLIGGIYSWPVAIGNLTHFTVGALVLSKAYISSHSSVILIPSLIYIDVPFYS